MEHLDPFTALLDAYLDGELSPEERSRVQSHLETCPDCLAYIVQWAAVRESFPGWEETEVPDGFADGVLETIRVGKAPQKRRAVRWKPFLAPIAACLLVAAALPAFQHHSAMTAASTAPAAADASANTGVATYSTPVGASGSEDDTLLESAAVDISDDDTSAVKENSDIAEAAPQISDAADAPSVTADAAPDDAEDSTLKSRAAIQETESYSMSPDAAAVPGDIWIEGENADFNAVVCLTSEQAGDALADYPGKPYYTRASDEDAYTYLGTGYALDADTFFRVLSEIGYDFDSLERTDTSALYCIVVTDVS